MDIFEQTSIHEIRQKSLKITAYLEELLQETEENGDRNPYNIITPSDPEARGAQLSVQLDDGLLDGVLKKLEEGGVVVDERKPDVIRVAPAPLYNSYSDVWEFIQIFRKACKDVKAEKGT